MIFARQQAAKQLLKLNFLIRVLQLRRSPRLERNGELTMLDWARVERLAVLLVKLLKNVSLPSGL